MSSLSSALSGPPPVPSRTRNLVENQLQAQQVGRDVQVLVETGPDPNPVSTKVAPPPRGGRPKPLSPVGTLSPYSTGTFPGKARASQRWAPGTLHSSMLPLPTKQDPPLAAAVRPYTPNLSDPAPTLQRPPTVAASSIYSMYTQQGALGKGQGSLPRRPRGRSRNQIEPDQQNKVRLSFCPLRPPSVRETSPPSQRGAAFQ